jgi:polar amino acid transport system substrate-binding protein
LLTVATFSACSDDDETSRGAAGSFTPIEPGVLTVATTLPAPGFWNVDDTGEVTGGFEFELAEELADRLDLSRVELVDLPDEILPEDEAGQYDVALNQISITPQRREEFDLSEPYLETPVAVVGTPEVDVDDLAAARDLHWGVVEGTTHVDLVEEQIRPRDGDVEVYESTEDSLDGVRDGEVDVVAVDYLRALADVSDTPELALSARVTAPQHYGIVLPEGSGNLEALNSAIRGLQSDGTLSRLRDDLTDSFEPGIEDGVTTIRVSE